MEAGARKGKVEVTLERLGEASDARLDTIRRPPRRDTEGFGKTWEALWKGPEGAEGAMLHDER